MHEKIEMKTNTRAVAVTAGWPMALALLVMGGMVLFLFPLREGWPMLLLRIIARLGRNEEVEISGVLRDEIIIKQGWLEKKLGVCHIRQKGTTVYLRGVQDMEKITAWVDANFPRERKVPPKPRKRK